VTDRMHVTEEHLTDSIGVIERSIEGRERST
jgi:hypothetical protein